MTEIEGYITIGKIVNTQGHRGEVRVIPTTDFPERFKQMKKMYVLQNGKLDQLQVERAYEHKRFFILKFSGIDDMDAAETLKGSSLVISKEELKPLPEDSFYIFDIIGLKVLTADGRFLGKVKDVLQTGANDVYSVERETKPELLVPALKKVVLKVDIAAGEMIVDLPEGLED